MKKTLIIAFSVALAATASAQERSVTLTLRETVALAVERNLDVKVDTVGLALGDADLRKNEAVYDTHLTMQAGYTDSTTRLPNRISEKLDSNTLRLSPGAYRLLETGGTLSLAFNNYLNTNTSTAAGAMHRYWQSDVTLSLMQPLLKNFGRDMTELNLDVSRHAREGAVERLRTRLLDTVARVRVEYGRLYSLHEELASRRLSLELARKVLDDTKARVKAGVQPAMEILNAEYGVASRDMELVTAEHAAADQSDVLRTLVQLEPGTMIRPADAPDTAAVVVDEEAAVKQAFASRPELAELKRNLDIQKVLAKASANRTKPDLNLTASAGMTGLGDSYGTDTSRLSSGAYPVWSVGLQLDVPLGNGVAVNDAVRSRLLVAQTQEQLKKLEDVLANEVRGAARAVRTALRQIEATARSRKFAEERLASFMRKSEVGLATTKELLDVENDLAVAKRDQIRASAAYADAVTRYWKATGELLDREHVTMKASEDAARTLYGTIR